MPACRLEVEVELIRGAPTGRVGYCSWLNPPTCYQRGWRRSAAPSVREQLLQEVLPNPPLPSCFIVYFGRVGVQPDKYTACLCALHPHHIVLCIFQLQLTKNILLFIKLNLCNTSYVAPIWSCSVCTVEMPLWPLGCCFPSTESCSSTTARGAAGCISPLYILTYLTIHIRLNNIFFVLCLQPPQRGLVRFKGPGGNCPFCPSLKPALGIYSCYMSFMRIHLSAG